MYVRYLAGFGALVLFLGVASTSTPQPDDAKNIQGSWKVVSLVKEQDRQPEEVLNKLRVKITKDQFIVTSPDKNEPLKFRLNPAKKPKEIDLLESLTKSVKDKGKAVSESSDSVMYGIYELTGDDLKICISTLREKPASRPTNFNAEQRTTVIVLKRDK